MEKLALSEKYMLSINEAGAYFNIGVKKMRRLAEEDNLPFMAMYGTQKLVIKDEFKKYLRRPGVKEGLANGKPRTKKRLEA